MDSQSLTPPGAAVRLTARKRSNGSAIMVQHTISFSWTKDQHPVHLSMIHDLARLAASLRVTRNVVPQDFLTHHATANRALFRASDAPVRLERLSGAIRFEPRISINVFFLLFEVFPTSSLRSVGSSLNRLFDSLPQPRRHEGFDFDTLILFGFAILP